MVSFAFIMKIIPALSHVPRAVSSQSVRLSHVPPNATCFAEFLHVKPGKGAAFVRSKLRNMLTGALNERSFRAGENLQIADMFRRDAQFTYKEGDDVSWAGGPAPAGKD